MKPEKKDIHKERSGNVSERDERGLGHSWEARPSQPPSLQMMGSGNSHGGLGGDWFAPKGGSALKRNPFLPSAAPALVQCV